MKCISAAEYDGLITARDERDRLARIIAAGDLNIRAKAEALVLAAKLQGYVIEIEQRPLTPLAMGNYEAAVIVRPARVRAERIVR